MSIKNITKKFDFDLPIMIPSLKRYTKAKKPTMMIDSCLSNLFRYYNASNVNVLGQEYTDEDKKYLMETYPDVTWDWHPTRMGIINTFNVLKEWAISLGDCYVHYDDDVKMSQQFDDNPTLVAMEHVMNMKPDRIGVVTVPSISIHHFTKQAKKYINLHSNPAQLVLINSKGAKECEYDSQFENFRSDTDFTMQLANQKLIPVMINRYFSFMHTVPLSKIEYDKDGKRKFQTLDNVKETRGSIGGDRRMEIRIQEYNAFQSKWPKVYTFKNYRQQVLKKSVVHLTEFKDEELEELKNQFDFSLVNNWHEEYYGANPPEMI